MRTRKHTSLLAIGALYMALVTSADAAMVLEPTGIKSALADSSGPSIADSWLAQARAGDFKTLEAQVQAALADPAITAVTRELALYEFVTGLRKLHFKSMPEDLLQQLSTYESQVFYWHPESRGTYKLPLFDVAGAAEGTLQFTERKQAAAHAMAFLQQKSTGFWQALSSAKSTLHRQGYLDALRKAPLNALKAQRATLDKATAIAHSEAGAILALRLEDAVLAKQVIVTAKPEIARLVVEAAGSHFPREQAFDLLKLATLRTQLASTAVGRIGVLGRQFTPAKGWLLEQLSDSVLGASVALALSKLSNIRLVEQIVADLRSDLDETATRNRLLFLHMAGDPAAKTALWKFAADPARPDHLRAEVQRWLVE